MGQPHRVAQPHYIINQGRRRSRQLPQGPRHAHLPDPPVALRRPRPRLPPRVSDDIYIFIIIIIIIIIIPNYIIIIIIIIIIQE